MAAKKLPGSERQDAYFYLLVAILFAEMIVGVASVFYGISRAAPETPGGPPTARFPWLAWIVGSVLAPAAILLVAHIIELWLRKPGDAGEGKTEDLPEGVRRFYASARHAPAIVVLSGVLLAGAALYFVDGALAALMETGKALAPHLPWIAGSAAAFLAVCVITRAFLVYKQRKLASEYAWRREVLERTGVILADKRAAIMGSTKTPPAIIDAAPAQKLPPGSVTTEIVEPDKKEDD